MKKTASCNPDRFGGLRVVEGCFLLESEEKKMKKRFYIAYGSNMNMEQMLRRCPDAEPIGTTKIKGFQLLFKGSRTGAYLTIEKAEGEHVPAAVWETTAEDEASLDRYEGCPEFYYKTEMDITVKEMVSGRKWKARAYVYIMHEEREIGMPSESYINTCFQGCWDFGIIDHHLRKAIVISQRHRRKMSRKPMSKKCPSCGRSYCGVPAISRKPGHADICPDCGTRESLECLGVGKVEQDRILRLIYKHMAKQS